MCRAKRRRAGTTGGHAQTDRGRTRTRARRASGIRYVGRRAVRNLLIVQCRSEDLTALSPILAPQSALKTSATATEKAARSFETVDSARSLVDHSDREGTIGSGERRAPVLFAQVQKTWLGGRSASRRIASRSSARAVEFRSLNPYKVGPHELWPTPWSPNQRQDGAFRRKSRRRDRPARGRSWCRRGIGSRSGCWKVEEIIARGRFRMASKKNQGTEAVGQCRRKRGERAEGLKLGGTVELGRDLRDD